MNIPAPTDEAETFSTRFDLTAPELAEGLADALDAVRERCPVTWSESHGGFWMVARHEDVMTVLQDWETFSSVTPASPLDPPDKVGLIPIDLDPPLQVEFRRPLLSHLSPPVIAARESAIRDVVVEVMQTFLDDGQCDFAAQFAKRVPGLMFFRGFLDLSPDDFAECHEWVEVFCDAVDFDEVNRAAAAGAGWIMSFVARRRQSPGDDIIDSLINATIEGRPITDDEIVRTMLTVIAGSMETTANASSNIVIHLAGSPELQAELRANPDLIPAAVDESLRLSSVIPYEMRLVTRDVDLAGQHIKKGERIVFWLTAANHDPRQFPEPKAFRLDRPSNRHLAFGGGPHRCIGAHLARTSLRIVTEEVLGRMSDLRLAEGTRPVRRFVRSQSVVSLPITFTPTQAR
jgi:cytochrome P450